MNKYKAIGIDGVDPRTIKALFSEYNDETEDIDEDIMYQVKSA
jgi:hypothetical protein